MPETSLTEYPYPQQWFMVSMTGVTWRELWEASFNPIVFLLAMLAVAPLKILRIPLPAFRLPREISFHSPHMPVPEPQASRVKALLNELAALGFRHFTTFIIPEVQHAPIKHYCIHEQRQAYANVTYWSTGAVEPMPAFVSGKSFVFAEFMTHFADGSHLLNIGRKGHPSISCPPEETVRYNRPDRVAELWKTHWQMVQEMAPLHGGLSPYMTAEELFTILRANRRRFADYQFARGAAYPIAGHASAPWPP